VSAKLHGIALQKTVILTLIIVRISDLILQALAFLDHWSVNQFHKWMKYKKLGRHVLEHAIQSASVWASKSEKALFVVPVFTELGHLCYIASFDRNWGSDMDQNVFSQDTW
jgi:hypothetical protein